MLFIILFQFVVALREVCMSRTVLNGRFVRPARIKKSKDGAVPLHHRNIFCEQYEQCLAKAAYDDTSFDCSICPLKLPRASNSRLTLDEVIGCYRLLHEIFNHGVGKMESLW